MRTIIIVGFILMATVSWNVRAQNLDQDCNPIVVPAECAQLSESIRSLETRIARLQQRLNSASPAAKADMLATIRRLNSELDTAKTELRSCLRDHGATPRESAANELTSGVTGRATLETTNDSAPGPHNVDDLDLELRFSRNRCHVTVTRFPSISIMTDRIRGVGRIRVTITRTGGGTGSFHPVSGRMNIAITLHFHYDTPLVADDDANFSLSTDGSITRNNAALLTGSPLDADGNIRFVGSGKFRNGFLGGSNGTLVIRATMSPRP